MTSLNKLIGTVGFYFDVNRMANFFVVLKLMIPVLLPQEESALLFS